MIALSTMMFAGAMANNFGLGAIMDDGNPSLWQIIKDFFVPVGGPAIGGLLGYLAARKKNTLLEGHLDVKNDVIQLDAITRHFEALLKGYEQRISDLTEEIDNLRDEVKNLRKALDERPRPGVQS